MNGRCVCCDESEKLDAQGFCDECLNSCELGYCTSILGNRAKAGQDRFFGLLREEYGGHVQLMPICQHCASILAKAELAA